MQLILDYETRSEADLKSLGAFEYAKHPSTEILCAGYKIENEPSKVWIPGRSKKSDREFFEAVRSANVIVCHNKMFEHCISEFVLPKYFGGPVRNFEHNLFRCSAAKAAMHGLPRDLERATRVLNLPIVKDMEGNRLMKKYMKPRPVWKKWKLEFDQGRAFDWEMPQKYYDKAEELERIFEYCRTDIEAEYYLDGRLSDLPPTEQKIWEQNQRMNFRGLAVDIDTTKKIIDLIELKYSALTVKLRELTGGRVKTPNQRDVLLKWIRDMGVNMPNLTAESVGSALKDPLIDPCVREALEIRQALARASVKKYIALRTRAPEGRLRDLALYHGAHTGRDTGTGFQPHNLPKGKIKNTDRAIEDIRVGDLDYIEMLYGDPFTVFASVVRGMIHATEGHRLFSADFNAIECRVLNWLAGQDSVLRDFERGVDLYVKMANRVQSEDRQLGKTIELACGFGMGAQKFMQTSQAWGVNNGLGVSEEFAQRAVKVYRASHPKVVNFWHTIERMVIGAVKYRGTKFKYQNGLLTVAMPPDDDFLTITLPSGRKLFYFQPRIRLEATPWNEVMPKIYYWHIDSKTKQWVCGSTYGGKLTENIVQAIARDVMFEAALRAEKDGYIYLFSVHDEIITESKTGNLAAYEGILMKRPEWAPNLPLVAKGWTDFRYRKS